MDNAFEFVMDYGITSQEIYEYRGRKRRCKKSKRDQPVARISGYQTVAPYSSNALKAALMKGPVSVAVQANQHAFMYYSGGVVDYGCDYDLNHGVLAVGYDSNEGYYIVKNSWGEYWGDKGYIKLGITEGPGVCGIQLMSSYPTINSS